MEGATLSDPDNPPQQRELLAPALSDLRTNQVAELTEERRAALLRLAKVQRQLDLLDDPTLAEGTRLDRAVRAAISEELAQDDEDPRAEFLRLLCNVGPERRSAAERDEAMVRALAAAFHKEAPKLESVLKSLRRRKGKEWEALCELADRLLADDPPLRRPWVHGGRHQADPARTGKLVLLTAHHGTGLSEAATRYAALVPDACVVNLDPAIEAAGRIYLEQQQGFNAIAEESNASALIYERSRRGLMWIARQALVAVWEDVLDGLRQGRVVVLTGAATVYHTTSGSISTAFNDAAFVDLIRRTRGSEPLEVRAALRDATAITLIDDVYDCFLRLQKSEEPFEASTAARSYRTRSAVLRTLLEWRQAEVQSAERLARLLGWRHVLLPVKHPAQTLVRIIAGAPIVTISHAGEDLRPDVDRPPSPEQQHLLELVRALHDGPAAVIDPMAIDEVRFDVPNGMERLAAPRSARLRPRWESIADLSARAGELLWTAPESELLSLAEQPLLPSSVPWEDIDISPLWEDETPVTLQMLQAELRRQQLWRSRLVVNQASGGLLVHRPFSGPLGQMRELPHQALELWRELQAHERRPPHDVRMAPGEHGPRTVVVHHPLTDEHQRFSHVLADMLVHDDLPGLRIDHVVDTALQQLLLPWVRTLPAEAGVVDIEHVRGLLAAIYGLPGGELRFRAGGEEARVEALRRELSQLRLGRVSGTVYQSLVPIDGARFVDGADDIDGAALARLFIEALDLGSVSADPPTARNP